MNSICLKLRSHIRGAVVERRRADFDIPAAAPWVCSHICGADAGGSAISWGLKVRSDMRGADEGGGGRKIGFNTNHYMRSHMGGRRAEAEWEQNPLRNKWVQHPIFRLRFETAHSKPSLSSRNGRPALVRSEYVWTYPRKRSRNVKIRSARLRSATTQRICEHSIKLRICHFLRTKMVSSTRFRSGRGKWVLDPFVAERMLLPLHLCSATAYVWTHVMICVEANFPTASALVRFPHVWTYLKYCSTISIQVWGGIL